MTKQQTSMEFSHAGVMPQTPSVRFLIEQTSDIAIHIDSQGVVAGIYVNPDCPSLGCLDHWVGRPFTRFLTEESREKFAERMEELRVAPDLPIGPIELNNSDNADWEFPIRYSPLRIDGTDGLLLIGRDLKPVAEVQQRLVQEQLSRERDQQAIRRAETYFRVVLEASETPLVTVDPETGRVREINSAASSLLGAKADALHGSTFNQAFEGLRRGELMEALHSASSPDEARSISAVARRSGRTVSIYPDFFRAAGELGMVCRLYPVGGEGTSNSDIAQSLNALFTGASDAIAIIDGKGVIREVNDAFLVLADAAQLRDVTGKTFSKFLVRGEVDLRLLIEGAMREGGMRSYTTQFKSIVGTRASVDMSATYLRPGTTDLGIGLIIRDIGDSGTTSDDGPQSVVSEAALQNVMDLVGTASLKELVSATSDVIERMCIDTALQMTKNNRAAAAEMLGLSRQSLYVKLRKYGMLSADGE